MKIFVRLSGVFIVMVDTKNYKIHCYWQFDDAEQSCWFISQEG